jgi:hypothetical protein
MRKQNITAAMEYRKKTTLATSCLQRSYHNRGTKTALCHIQHPKILQKICFHVHILYDVLLHFIRLHYYSLSNVFAFQSIVQCSNFDAVYS